MRSWKSAFPPDDLYFFVVKRGDEGRAGNFTKEGNVKKFSKTVYFGDTELEVEYTYYPGCKGGRDSLGGIPGAGPPLEPDEPSAIEIMSVWTVGDIHALLSEDQLEKIEAQLWESD